MIRLNYIYRFIQLAQYKWLFILAFNCCALVTYAQSSYMESAFFKSQMTIPKIHTIITNETKLLFLKFKKLQLVWPPSEIYLRDMKYDGILQLWVRNPNEDTFVLFKTYKVCAISGQLGPKRIQNDFQVPEGFYYINAFNPFSNYDLSLKLDYPNLSDKIISHQVNPGGDIYIHGSCASIGCIPITDKEIEELYTIAVYAKANGEDFIPIHIFPIAFNDKESNEYLYSAIKSNPSYLKFLTPLKIAYSFFEKYKKLPYTATDSKGNYLIIDTTINKEEN